MEKFNENEGYWRTIGGRRVFIRNSESLSEAMKKSGKFKSSKKRNIKDDSESNQPEKRDDKSEYKFEDKERESEYQKQLEKAREENQARDKQDRVNYQKNQIEEASGLKVEKAFETDAFGTGKEDRFKLSDGRYIAHSTESMGSKEDSWSINKVEGGKINSQEFKSYDDMIKYLSGSGSDNSNRMLVEKDTGSAFSTPGKKYTLLEESKSAYGDKIYKVKDEKGDISWQKASKFEEKSADNSNKPGSKLKGYAKAYEEYKKKHPNTKITINQFIKYSEGKE